MGHPHQRHRARELDQPLIDAYAVYQLLLDQWAESMQDDVYAISAEGWRAEPYRLLETGKNGKTKDKGWACDLVPKELLVRQLFAGDLELIEALRAQLEEASSRLAELVRLCLPDAPGETGAGWLAWGALPTGERQGLAWVEMARGLLIHQVALAAPAPGAAPVVRSCQVLAPTEWNLHPGGVAAQALAAWPADAPDLDARVHLLMAALDPCVPFQVTPRDETLEVSHA